MCIRDRHHALLGDGADQQEVLPGGEVPVDEVAVVALRDEEEGEEQEQEMCIRDRVQSPHEEVAPCGPQKGGRDKDSQLPPEDGVPLQTISPFCCDMSKKYK